MERLSISFADISDAFGEVQNIVQSLELEDVPTWVVLLAILALLLYSVPPLFVLGMACSAPKDPCLQDPLLAMTVFAGSFIAWPWIILFGHLRFLFEIE